MRLLHVIAQMDPALGGVGEAVRVTVKKLNEQGTSNEVLSLDHPDAPFLKKENIEIHALGPGKTAWCYSEKLMPWLMMNASNYHSIILHGMWLYPGFAVRRAIDQMWRMDIYKKKKKPGIYVMPHGMLDPYFQQAAGRRLKAIRNWFYWKLIEARVVQDADGLLFTCEEELNLARKTFRPYKPQKEITVGLGVPEPPDYQNKMKQEFLKKCPEVFGRRYLLFLGRIHPKKGVDMLIGCYQKYLSEGKYGQIHSSGCNTDASLSQDTIEMPRLVIAGPGMETPFGQLIRKRVNDDPVLKKYILFPGMLLEDAKWGAFYGCEAFILPSHQENFGIAVVEALACGRPVLISDQVNIWREIAAGGGGFIANDSSVGTSNLLYQWFCLPEEEKCKMMIQARKTYEHYFSNGPAAIRFYQAVAH